MADPRLSPKVAALSTVAWLSIGFVYYLGFRAFHIHLGYDAGLLLAVATTLGFFFPSSPGAFGVYHAIAIGTLTKVFGIDYDLAVSYALVIHLVFYVQPIFVGTAFMWLERKVWQPATLFGKLAELRGELSPATASD